MGLGHMITETINFEICRVDQQAGNSLGVANIAILRHNFFLRKTSVLLLRPFN